MDENWPRSQVWRVLKIDATDLESRRQEATNTWES